MKKQISIHMKHKYLLAIFFTISCTYIYAQTCLPDGITFTRQSQVDSFNMVYPDCTELVGNLKIESANNTDITNVEALQNITKINGDLQISENSLLGDLAGLKNLTEIEGNLIVFNNPGIINVLGLNNLKQVGQNVSIANNGKLTTLDGLDNLLGINGNLSIRNNDFLIRLSSLENLLSINGELTVWGNGILSTLEGLENIDHNTITRLEVRENPELAECATPTICSYIENDGQQAFGNNAFGCSVYENVLGKCSMILDINENFEWINLSPNPATHQIIIEGIEKAEYTLSNTWGEILSKGNLTSNRQIELSQFPKGIYLITLTDDNFNWQKKIIKL